LSIKMGQLGNYAPLHHEEICSGWSIFGYQNPALLVNFRLSKPYDARQDTDFVAKQGPVDINGPMRKRRFP
ncbi:MAG: hypothetical protein ACLPN1_16430, partial [Dissulfurispiraceae bacterium]